MSMLEGMAAISHRWGSIPERTRDRTVDASTEGNPATTALLVALGILLAWILSYAAGGSKSALPHAFYVPVIVGAIRFRCRGALIVSLAAGVVAGPLMPLDMSSGAVQEPTNWLTRLAFFVLVGQITAYLSRYSLPSLTEEVGGRRFANELLEAIDGGQLQVVYQPIVNLTTGELAGVEALVRWEHPTRGVIRPDEFIPRAERFGCVHAVTHFVLTEACQQVAEWRESVLSDVKTFRLAVNISSSDLDDHALAVRVAEVLERTGLPNAWLYLEVTETALVGDVEHAVDALMTLRMLGVRLAIDDFGTGESSLGHLDQFPIDLLKVDRIFLRRISDDHDDDALTHGICALAHAMNLAVVAEGVESSFQARAVQAFGYDFAQGFLFSQGVPASELEQLLLSPERFRNRNLRHLNAPSSSAAGRG